MSSQVKSSPVKYSPTCLYATRSWALAVIMVTLWHAVCDCDDVWDTWDMVFRRCGAWPAKIGQKVPSIGFGTLSTISVLQNLYTIIYVRILLDLFINIKSMQQVSLCYCYCCCYCYCYRYCYRYLAYWQQYHESPPD